jgi:hypothetical protein
MVVAHTPRGVALRLRSLWAQNTPTCLATAPALQEPKPFVGLIHKPPCAACTQSMAAPQPPPPMPLHRCPCPTDIRLRAHNRLVGTRQAAWETPIAIIRKAQVHDKTVRFSNMSLSALPKALWQNSVCVSYTRIRQLACSFGEWRQAMTISKRPAWWTVKRCTC